jgi:pyridoxal phosphate enzyme (YggS family)
MTIAQKLAEIRQNIEKARKNSPLAHNQLEMMAVSKGHGEGAILNAIEAGIVLFGENRVQEAQQKWPSIQKQHPRIKLHLIGPLQTNKVKDALELFDAIQTLDRPKLALAIAKEMEMRRCGDMEKEKPTFPHPNISSSSHPIFYIQINTGEEPQKAGVIPSEADDFIRYCKNDLKLNVVGLMCIPPAEQVPAPHFAMLREIAKRNGLHELSMGMSGDYETAVRMGSSCVRIGTALFGERKAD